MLGTELAISATGVGGPGPDEGVPAGTVFIACADRAGEVVDSATRACLQMPAAGDPSHAFVPADRTGFPSGDVGSAASREPGLQAVVAVLALQIRTGTRFHVSAVPKRYTGTATRASRPDVEAA